MNGYGDQPEFRFDKIQFDPFKKYIIPIAFVIGIIILGYSSIFTVKANQEATILRFGKYMETVGPGLHFKLPFGVDRVYAGEVKRIYNEEFGYRTLRSGRESMIDYNFRGASEVSLMLTGDRNCAVVHWVVRYKIKNLKDFLFNVRNVKSTIRDVSEAVMRRIVGNRSIDEVLTIGRRGIEGVAEKEIESFLDSYGCGIDIQVVNLKGVNPPEQVKDAFDAVNKAVQLRDQITNEAEGKKNKVIPAAMGKKEQAIREAEGYKIKRINEATGDTKAFLAVWREYEKAKDVTRRRLYLETMEKAIPKCDEVYIIDKDQKGILPILKLGESKVLK
ncbi:membrane protease subunits, stomatin/prohibitin homologs [Candidatus Scalindua japonica]|uniref:Protein HflK n=1 Tax=Candidatus Scalindua japonica TaxID=1284222 RepID=A0A286TTR0_9BACT|nr:FtsH protease activity modulator HflK [Candidatus Scalindua japonica]GAX59267.1 membrane protease subunits, stomatin/prohibitin homologs [Candidatus Scalindua japonica]